MEKVEFLGIVFRSASHLGWFKITLIGFVISVIMSFVEILIYKKQSFVYYILNIMALFHAAALIEAIIISKFGTVNGPVYSVDCIWFNASVAFIYYLLYRLSKFFVKK